MGYNCPPSCTQRDLNCSEHESVWDRVRRERREDMWQRSQDALRTAASHERDYPGAYYPSTLSNEALSWLDGIETILVLVGFVGVVGVGLLVFWPITGTALLVFIAWLILRHWRTALGIIGLGILVGLIFVPRIVSRIERGVSSQFIQPHLKRGIVTDDLRLRNPPAAVSYSHWKVYTNGRWHFKVCYPADLLIPQRGPVNGDGEQFLARDGGKLAVFGDWKWSSGEEPLQELKERFQEIASSFTADRDGRITYEVMTPDWFVISGEGDDTIFYVKTFYSNEAFKSLILIYPVSASSVYKPLIRHLERSFADLSP